VTVILSESDCLVITLLARSDERMHECTSNVVDTYTSDCIDGNEWAVVPAPLPRTKLYLPPDESRCVDVDRPPGEPPTELVRGVADGIGGRLTERMITRLSQVIEGLPGIRKPRRYGPFARLSTGE